MDVDEPEPTCQGCGDTVQIRQLVRSEASQYRDFRIAALARDPTAFTSTPDEERARPLSWSEARIRCVDAPDDCVMGAFLDNSLIGMAGFSRPELRQARHKGLLFGMAVAPQVGGRGIGRRIVLAIIEHAARIEGMRQITLTYTEGNIAAERLYRACGFETFGQEIRAVVIDGLDVTKMHMVRLLDGDAGLRGEVNLDGVRMAASLSSALGSVGPEDQFVFEQVGDVVSARYRGGAVIDGYLIGWLRGRRLRFRYVQAGRDGGLDAGMSDASIETLADGRLRLNENFTWLTRPGRGTNVFEEVESDPRKGTPACT